MHYFIQNTDFDNSIREIKTKIRTSMNGIVAGAMKDYGVVYKQNFGVEVPRLREIASKYAPNHELALRLWVLKIRETMILATLIASPEKFTVEMADEWLKSVNQIELAEQTSMNLFSKLNFSTELGLRWTNSEEIWHQITGFTLATRIWNEFSDEQLKIIIQRAVTLTSVDEFHLYKAIAFCLSRFCRKGKETSEYIVNQINKFESSENQSEKYVFNEIKNELSFLNFY